MSRLSEYCEDARASEVVRGAKKIVYTVMFGSSDRLKQPAILDDDFDYYCITNRADLDFGIWKPILVSSIHRDSRRTARIFKLRPDLIFDTSELSVFVDASILILRPIGEFVRNYCTGSAIACFRHGARDCAYEEARACLLQGKDDPDTIRAQMRAYRRAGYPEHSGLVASGVLVRSHEDPEIRTLMDEWLQEIETRSVRDQLSFNYASWKLAIAYNEIDLDIFNNPYFEVKPHTGFQLFGVDGLDVATRSEKARHRALAIRAKVLHLWRRLARR